MPIYEYRCNNCGEINEFFQRVSDSAPEHCPDCGASGVGNLEKLMSQTSFILKR